MLTNIFLKVTGFSIVFLSSSKILRTINIFVHVEVLNYFSKTIAKPQGQKLSSVSPQNFSAFKEEYIHSKKIYNISLPEKYTIQDMLSTKSPSSLILSIVFTPVIQD